MVAPIQRSTLTTDFGWNAAAGRYIDLDTGRYVSFSAVRDALEDVMSAASARMNDVTQQLLNGDISLASWQETMMEQIKLSHTAATAAANGGWAQVSQSDWGFAGAEIKEQYQYLRNFADQIASGEQPLDGRVMVRSDMYGDAARGTFEDVRWRNEKAGGMDEARRILGSADHCDDCIEAADEGWVPIDDVLPIGDSVCKTNCQCEIEYRNSSEAMNE